MKTKIKTTIDRKSHKHGAAAGSDLARYQEFVAELARALATPPAEAAGPDLVTTSHHGSH